MATRSNVTRRTWTIDVCRTCGRHAVWPFCEHRDQPAPEGFWSWCEPVTVVERWPSRSRRVVRSDET